MRFMGSIGKFTSDGLIYWRGTPVICSPQAGVYGLIQRNLSHCFHLPARDRGRNSQYQIINADHRTGVAID